MKKNMLYTLIALMTFMVLAFTGCNSNASTDSGNNSPTASTTTSATINKTPDKSAALLTPTSQATSSVKPTASQTATTSATSKPTAVNTATPKPSPTTNIYTTTSRMVVIDAGHGGMDPGTSGFGVYEKDIALDVSKRLNALLKSMGIETYMIREDDTFSDFPDRIKLANEKKAALYLSIHCDSFDDPSVKGTATFYHPTRKTTLGGLTELQYATNIQEELVKKIGTVNRGLKDGSELGVIRAAEMPSALVELGFLSSPNDAALLKDESFRQKIAEGLAEGIKKSLEAIDNKTLN